MCGFHEARREGNSVGYLALLLTLAILAVAVNVLNVIDVLHFFKTGKFRLAPAPGSQQAATAPGPDSYNPLDVLPPPLELIFHASLILAWMACILIAMPFKLFATGYFGANKSSTRENAMSAGKNPPRPAEPEGEPVLQQDANGNWSDGMRNKKQEGTNNDKTPTKLEFAVLMWAAVLLGWTSFMFHYCVAELLFHNVACGCLILFLALFNLAIRWDATELVIGLYVCLLMAWAVLACQRGWPFEAYTWHKDVWNFIWYGFLWERGKLWRSFGGAQYYRLVRIC